MLESAAFVCQFWGLPTFLRFASKRFFSESSNIQSVKVLIFKSSLTSLKWKYRRIYLHVNLQTQWFFKNWNSNLIYFWIKTLLPAQLPVLDPDNWIYNIINSKETFFSMFTVWIKKHKERISRKKLLFYVIIAPFRFIFQLSELKSTKRRLSSLTHQLF